MFATESDGPHTELVRIFFPIRLLQVREAVVGTALGAAGSFAVGWVLTWILPTSLEDVLAISLALLGVYVGVLNLPLRRAAAKAKVWQLGYLYACVPT